MNYKYLLSILILLSCRLTVHANYNFNTRCQEAYKAIFDLRLSQARAIIAEEKKQNPQNGITILLDNYVDYYSLLASENKSDYEKLMHLRADRIDALSDNKENSPYYLFSRAEIYLQWGLLKGRFGDYSSSEFDFSKARSLLKTNAEKYPDFLPDQKSLAIINVVFGAIPSNLKIWAGLFGMKGNVEEGLTQLEKFKLAITNTKYSFYNNETISLLCFLDIDVLHNKDNYNKLMGLLAGMDNTSAFKKYLQGYVAFKTFHNDEAINFFEAIPRSSQYTSLPLADYFLGNAKLCRMDTDANVYLLKYVNEYKGVNFIKDAYVKLAYYSLFKNDREKYASYINMVHTRGYATDEKDKQAIKEADDVQPNISLLKARFYYDGGYESKALDELKIHQEKDFNPLRDKIEFNYRLGRIYEKLEKFNEAIACYQRSIVLGKATAYYYSANAALSIGGIFEHKKDYKNAAIYYKQALDMRDHEYQNSIDTQAKDGLNRINR